MWSTQITLSGQWPCCREVWPILPCVLCQWWEPTRRATSCKNSSKLGRTAYMGVMLQCLAIIASLECSISFFLLFHQSAERKYIKSSPWSWLYHHHQTFSLFSNQPAHQSGLGPVSTQLSTPWKITPIIIIIIIIVFKMVTIIPITIIIIIIVNVKVIIITIINWWKCKSSAPPQPCSILPDSRREEPWVFQPC